MVEQRTENPRVAGSIPALGTIFVTPRLSHYSLPRAPVTTESLGKLLHVFILLIHLSQFLRETLHDPFAKLCFLFVFLHHESGGEFACFSG